MHTYFRWNGEGRIALFDDEWNDIKEVNEDMRIGYCGMGCTLIKKEVLESLYKEHEKPLSLVIFMEKMELDTLERI